MSSEYKTVLGIVLSIVGVILSFIPFVVPYVKTASRKRKACIVSLAALLLIVSIFLCSAPLTAISLALGSDGSSSTASKAPSSTVAFTPMTSPSSIATPTPTDPPTPSPTPQPTPPKSGTLLFPTNGVNWLIGWTGGSSWNTSGNTILNTGQDTSTSLAPYHPGDNNIANYAIEAQIQLNRYTDQGQMGGIDSFGIIVRSPDGQQGYTLSVCASSGFGFSNCGSNVKEVFISNGQSTLAENPYQPRYNDWHTYRIEVKNNTIKVFIDGINDLSLTDNTYLSGGKVGLWSSRCQIGIRSFKVIAL